MKMSHNGFRWALKPVAAALIRKPGGETGESPGEDGGRNWNKAAKEAKDSSHQQRLTLQEEPTHRALRGNLGLPAP